MRKKILGSILLCAGFLLCFNVLAQGALTTTRLFDKNTRAGFNYLLDSKQREGKAIRFAGAADGVAYVQADQWTDLASKLKNSADISNGLDVRSIYISKKKYSDDALASSSDFDITTYHPIRLNTYYEYKSAASLLALKNQATKLGMSFNVNTDNGSISFDWK